MDKIFTKKIFLIVFFCGLIISAAKAQTITIGTVSPGPYGLGSTIAVPFNINTASGCVQISNVFNLYLSDESGSFASQRLIGSYSGFYGAFVNGVIPNDVPAGSGYRVRISSTAPAITTSASAAFTINAITGITASAATQAFNVNHPEVYGSCIGTDNTSYSFINSSTSGTTVTANFYNEQDRLDEGTRTFSPGLTFIAKAANYTVLVKATNANGVVGTKAYQLINNVVNNGFSNSGSTSVCLDGKNKLTYTVDVTTARGIEKNYPGFIYNVNWGDGLSDNYTLCDIVNAGGVIDHLYKKASCGNVANGQVNVFQVDFQPVSPYCGKAVTPFTAYARVIEPPKNKFTAPVTGCINTVISFTNTSIPGQDPNSTTFDCTNINARYTWSVDGEVIAVNYTKDQNFEHTFTTKGMHRVTLHLQNGSDLCEVEDELNDICIQEAPKPSFELLGSTICTSGSVPLKNTSVIDANCNTQNTYNWIVTGPAPVRYGGGTSAGSETPQFNFTASGLYKVQLAITTASCGVVLSTEDFVTVNLSPRVSLSANALICGTNRTLSFDPTAVETKTTITGTERDLPTTYNWTVTGGAYEYADGTTEHSRYPKILFKEYATYTISVRHDNNCGTASGTQTITFQEAPTVNAGLPQRICEGGTAALTGEITGTVQSFQWVGGTGTFTQGRNQKITGYTPSAAEIAAGTVTLSLQARTNLAAPCDLIISPITITITQKDKVTSPAIQEVCTGQNFHYTITSQNTTSTYRWTTSLTSGSATGFGPSGQGNTINDVITNTSGASDAVVTYTITPITDGCDGVPFQMKVTVERFPVITGAPTNATICSNEAAGITITSNIPASTTYTWTSTSTITGITGNTDQPTPVTGNTIQDMLVNTNTVIGVVTYTITPYHGVCPGEPITVSVNVMPLPLPSQPGPDAEICAGPTYTLQGNSPAPGTGLWTLVSGQAGVTFSDPTNPNAVLNGLKPGNVYQFMWTITAAPSCPPTSNVVTITVDEPTIAGTTSGAATVCGNDNAGFITLAGNNGSILRWEFSVDNGATWVVRANLTNQEEYKNLTQTTQYRAIVQNGVCNIETSAITTITVNQPATIANAGVDPAPLCNANTTVLSANDPAPTSGLWTQTGGPPAVIADPTNPKTQVTGLVGGNIYTFRWTIKGIQPCADNFDEVTVVDNPDVIASFVADRTEGCGPLAVQFSNTSLQGSNSTNYLWDFGDGTNTSQLASPEHTFQPSADGRDAVYKVSLIILDNCDPTRPPFVMEVTVKPVVPVARVLPETLTACGTLALRVKNVSPGTNLKYTFYLYDDNGLLVEPPIEKTDKSDAVFQALTPTKTTVYKLKMIATGFCNNTGQTPEEGIPITISPASFQAQSFIKNNLNKGCAPFNAVFVNNSSDGNIITYVIFDENDQEINRIPGSRTEQNYVFTTPGTYYVQIRARNDCGEVIEPTKHRVDVFPTPTPNFVADVTSGCKRLVVKFTNSTTINGNTPATSLTYDWDFGDGSAHYNGFTPQPHIYTYKNSPYTVTLTATNPATDCPGTITKTSYIIVNPPPGVDFVVKPDSITKIPNYHFAFDDITSGNPVAWHWDFGDGHTDNGQNPGHTYSDTGTYKVTLRVTSREGCDSLISHKVQITGIPGQLYLPNAFTPESSTTELRTFSAKGSGIAIWSLQIYNKWGQLMWETTKLDSKGEPADGWNGTFKGAPVPQGVYVWQASAKFINGTEWKGMTYNSSLPKRSGVIHLIR